MTMVLAMASVGGSPGELRHNFSWLVTEQEVTYSPRVRFGKPVAVGGERPRHLSLICSGNEKSDLNDCVKGSFI